MATTKPPKVRKLKSIGEVLPTPKDITIKTSFKEDQPDKPEEEKQEEKLPIDKLVDIATNKGLLPKEESTEKRFDRFIKAIKLHEIIYDCMQSSLNEYCKEYNKKNPDDNLGLKLHVRKRTNPDSKVIFAVSCVLEVRRAGKYYELFEKRVDFTHVKEVRDEASWKYALYGAVYNDLINNSINYLLLRDDVKSGRIKSEVSTGPTA